MRIFQYFPGAGVESILQDDVSHTEDSEAIKYTYIHNPKTSGNLQPESVSEVLLNNGTILRQTFIGTHPPRNYVASVREGQTEAAEKEVSDSSAEKEAAESSRENLKLNVDDESNSVANGSEEAPAKRDDISKKEERVTSPYMVIRAPILGIEDGVPGNLSEDAKSCTDEESSAENRSPNKVI